MGWIIRKHQLGSYLQRIGLSVMSLSKVYFGEVVVRYIEMHKYKLRFISLYYPVASKGDGVVFKKDIIPLPAWQQFKL